MNKINKNIYLNYKCSSSYFMSCFLCLLTVALLLFGSSIWSAAKYSGSYQYETPHLNENSLSFSLSYVGLLLLLMMVFLLVFSLWIFKTTFNFSISWGSTRTDYFLGSTLYYIIISAIFSVLHTIMYAFESAILKYNGIKQLNNYSFIFDNFNFRASLKLTLYIFLIFITIISVVTMLSIVANKLGAYGWAVIIVVVICIPIFVIPVLILNLPDFKATFAGTNLINTLISMLCMAISYYVIKATSSKRL